MDNKLVTSSGYKQNTLISPSLLDEDSGNSPGST